PKIWFSAKRQHQADRAHPRIRQDQGPSSPGGGPIHFCTSFKRRCGRRAYWSKTAPPASMNAMFGSASLLDRAHSLIWEPVLDDLPCGQRALSIAARIGRAVIRDLLSGALSLRAMSLVYPTLLSIAPSPAI